MTREEKCKLAIEKGFIYNKENGKVYSKFNREVKTKDNRGYTNIKIRINGKQIKLLIHQFAWFITYGEIVECIDHINGVRDDNRVCNLRSVTKHQNLFNTKAKGYYYCKVKCKYKAQIQLNYKIKYLGSFDTEEEAIEVYLKSKEKYHIIK